MRWAGAYVPGVGALLTLLVVLFLGWLSTCCLKVPSNLDCQQGLVDFQTHRPLPKILRFCRNVPIGETADEKPMPGSSGLLLLKGAKLI